MVDPPRLAAFRRRVMSRVTRRFVVRWHMALIATKLVEVFFGCLLEP
jgi:hypothetical protein